MVWPLRIATELRAVIIQTNPLPKTSGTDERRAAARPVSARAAMAITGVFLAKAHAGAAAKTLPDGPLVESYAEALGEADYLGGC
jgi:hypothetical protein